MTNQALIGVEPIKGLIEQKHSWQFGVAIFKGKKKVKEIKFKNEKDMAYWLYKNECNYSEIYD